jgi:hypothetical protein
VTIKIQSNLNSFIFQYIFNTAFLAVCPRHRPAQTGTNRHRHLPAGLDRYKTGTDRPGLFYDVFDKNFVLNSPKRHDILKILIKPVSASQGRSVPVGVGRCRGRCRLFGARLGRSMPVPVGAGRCRLVPMPVVTDADRCICA